MSKLAAKSAPFTVTNQGTFAEISIIGDINWWSNSSADFTRLLVELRALGVTELRGYINSAGGSMWDGNEIYNQIAAFPGRKTCVLGALAASAATTIACAFSDGIEMAANGQYMIHNPCLSVDGGGKELASALQLYTNIRQAAVDIYVKRTGLKAEEVSDMMEATTWMTPSQAKEKGFITGITGTDDELPTDTAEVFNLYKVKNVPAALNQAALAASATTNFSASSTMNKVAITNSLGLNSNATDAEVENAVAQNAARVKQLQDELKSEKEKVTKERAELLVDNAIAAKKLPAGKREAWVTNATANYDSVKELVDSIAAPVQATNQVVPDEQAEVPTNGAGTGAADDRSKWVLKDYVEKAPADLKNMAEKDPAKYRQLVTNAYPQPGK